MRSSSSSSSALRRLTSIGSHLSAPTKHKIVLTRDLGPDVMPMLTSRDDIELVTWPDEANPCTREWLLKNAPGAEGIIILLSMAVDNDLLDAAGPSLKAVSTMSVGYEHVDIAALGKRGVRLGYTPDVLTDAVADVSIMLALMSSRNDGKSLTLAKDGLWPSFTWAPFSFCGPQLSVTPERPTLTVGFLGFGRISQATLRRLVPFGVTRVLYATRPDAKADPAQDAKWAETFGVKEVKRASHAEIAAGSDVVFALAPGGPSTYHIVNEDFLRGMKKTAVLVNAGRGTVVDTDALVKALKEGWIWGAGLDVIEGEPNIGKDHPLVQEPKCVLLPHIGSATHQTRRAMASRAVRNVIAGIKGEQMEAEVATK
ncbi:uncharacterized protein SCHCODRAFT_02637300 [Schizophyllum commune H4-8]|uniref:Glyoxylate reductase n=1 Tax=Schizophyllum commune (strain H4-8 / FGSC 9210) TaxID=578458 RepID=D8QDN5_SCHCM|nr:uncharacterized protein SCHCODRAFT_02637300 [Schizophyllum commune H4-8]KAI5888646.1 hypothetical protein SCHCODRAFT_02637300 [Schizophyllum commune H4-8]